jgi:hypothetical protein
MRENCASETQQQLQTTGPTSLQRTHPTSTNAQLSEDDLKKKKKKNLVVGL